MYVYFFSQLLQENLEKLEHGLAPHSEVDEVDGSIAEPASANLAQANTAQANTAQANTVET